MRGEGAVNRHSSRSHALCRLFVASELQTASGGRAHSTAVLTLCDLAGSEDVGRSGATGETLDEAKKINTSLLALGNVISALTTSGKGHVPFRDSVLTRLLEQSIGAHGLNRHPYATHAASRTRVRGLAHVTRRHMQLTT